MKIVITGCAGFIGLNFTRYWLEKHPYDKIIGIDALTYAANTDDIYALARSESNLSFYHADICNADAIRQIFKYESPDAVVNFAAQTHVDRSIESSAEFIKTNVLGTQVLLDACLEFGGIRFHQISTDEVYGDLPLESNRRFTESSPLLPSSPYSASKAAADLLTLSYYKTHGVPVTISRCANNYGPYQNAEKLIPKCIEALLFGGKIPVYGDGLNVREWVSVFDHCKALDLILHADGDGQIYNVGSGYEISNIALIKKIALTMRKLLLDDVSENDDCICHGANIKNDITEEFSMQISENIEFVPDRKGHDRRYSISSDKIKSSLGWSATADFDAELKRTAQWYKNR